MDIHSYEANSRRRLLHHGECYQMNSKRKVMEKPSFAFLRIYCKFGMYWWFSGPHGRHNSSSLFLSGSPPAAKENSEEKRKGCKSNEKKNCLDLLNFHNVLVYVGTDAALLIDTFQLTPNEGMVIQRSDYSSQSIALINQ